MFLGMKFEKINIIKGGSVAIQCDRDFKEEIKASKTAFRISKTTTNKVVIHLDGSVAFRCEMSDITIQDGRSGAPEQLTPENWGDLTDGLNDSKGGVGGGDADGKIAAHNTSPGAHQDIRDELAKKVEAVAGKGLSANDLTDELLQLLQSALQGADLLGFVKNPTWNGTQYVLTLPVDGKQSLVIDLPVEALLKDLRYDEDTNELVLVTDMGDRRVPLNKLVVGLASEAYVNQMFVDFADTLHKVAFTGNYDDLENLPIPGNSISDLPESTELISIDSSANYPAPEWVMTHSALDRAVVMTEHYIFVGGYYGLQAINRATKEVVSIFGMTAERVHSLYVYAGAVYASTSNGGLWYISGMYPESRHVVSTINSLNIIGEVPYIYGGMDLYVSPRYQTGGGLSKIRSNDLIPTSVTVGNFTKSVYHKGFLIAAEAGFSNARKFIRYDPESDMAVDITGMPSDARVENLAILNDEVYAFTGEFALSALRIWRINIASFSAIEVYRGTTPFRTNGFGVNECDGTLVLGGHYFNPIDNTLTPLSIPNGWSGERVIGTQNGRVFIMNTRGAIYRVLDRGAVVLIRGEISGLPALDWSGASQDDVFLFGADSVNYNARIRYIVVDAALTDLHGRIHDKWVSIKNPTSKSVMHPPMPQSEYDALEAAGMLKDRYYFTYDDSQS